jgi:glycosyltransferase involved in cell wall biosynthesis
MRILFFEPHITGHRQEYINHLIDYVIDQQLTDDFIFVVNPGFVCFKLPIKNIDIVRLSEIQVESLNSKDLLKRSRRIFMMLNEFVKQYSPNHVCFLNFNDIQIPLVFNRVNYGVSGILFKPFSRLEKNSFRQWLTYQRKYFQTWFFTRNRRIKNVFILNDDKSAGFLNQTFKTDIFQMLPDPVPQLNPEPDFNSREHFEIESNRKIFLHIGSLLKRKGTLDIIDSLSYLTKEELSRFTLLIIGHAEPDMDREIRRRLQNTKRRKAKGERQKTITYGRYPIPDTRYHNEFVSGSIFKSCIDQCDLVLVPYRYTESSSGIVGHAIAAGKPMLAVSRGLLGEMIAKNGTGVFIEDAGPKRIAAGFRQALAINVTGSYSVYCHTFERGLC